MTKHDRVAFARTYVYEALDGAINHSQYDPVMMPWAEARHAAIMYEVAKIRDRYKPTRKMDGALAPRTKARR